MRCSLLPCLMLVAISLGGCATEYHVTPVADGAQRIRFSQGIPTTFSEKHSGAVQVTALGLNGSNRPIFQIAAYNRARVPANFGVENLTLQLADGSYDKVFTSDDLVHEAKVDAQWAVAGTILAGALVAGAAQANSYSTTNATLVTPYGNASYYSRTYNPALAYAGTAAAGAATGYSIAKIEASLDGSIAAYRNKILQTTTIDPDNSYGGAIVADGLSSSKFPENILLRVSWNGDTHDFTFLVSKDPAAVGQIAPPTAIPSVFKEPGAPEGRLRVNATTDGTYPGGSAERAQPNQQDVAPGLVGLDQWKATSHAKAGR